MKPFSLNIERQLVVFIFLCSFFSGYSQSIFTNDITDGNPSVDNPYINGQIVDPNIMASGIGRGVGINGNTGLNRYNARDWSLVGLDNDDYFYFTITPNAGYEIDFSSFVFGGQSSGTGPVNFVLRSSLDGYTTDIVVPSGNGSTIDLSGAFYQNISTPITFRFYAWGGSNTAGTYSINDFIFNGTVFLSCTSTTIWDGTNWNPVIPDNTTEAIINAPYDTSLLPPQDSFEACSLIVNADLDIRGTDYVKVINDITINNSTVSLTTRASLVQVNDNGLVTLNGTGIGQVTKTTAHLENWYEYTYWSSMFSDETIGNGLLESDPARRFWFNGANFVDEYEEFGNDNSTNPGQDDIDDNGDDWQYASATNLMTPGIGYAATHNRSIFIFPAPYSYILEGTFNNGLISVPIIRNDTYVGDTNWNLIGNPYPSAIDVDLFFAENNFNATTNQSGTLGGAIYIWSQSTPPSETNNGNEQINFSTADYAMINELDELPGGDNNNDGVIDIDDTPLRFIPSGQGFFVDFTDLKPTNTGNIIFNNSMRVPDNNSQFFREPISSRKHKLKLKLTSDNGITNYASICYDKRATNEFDGFAFDAPRNLASGTAAIIYTIIDGNSKKFAIQGRSIESLNNDESIQIGFTSTIQDETQFKFSIANLEGEYLSKSTVYLYDRVLDIEHNLSQSDYEFNSGSGEFNSRFEISFNKISEPLDISSPDDLVIKNNQNNSLEISTTHKSIITSIQVYDILGRLLLNEDINEETTFLSLDSKSFSKSIYIIKATIQSEKVITKKVIY